MMTEGSANRRPTHERRPASALAATVPTELWSAGLAEAAKWNGKVCETFATAGTQYLDFVGRRFQEDMGFLQQLSQCRCPKDLQDTYVGFWRRAAEDYQKEFAVMARLGTTLVNDGMKAAQAQAKATARDTKQLSEAA